MAKKIQFLGAAGTVTGSRTLVSHNGTKTLVDCGLFQGPKARRLLNWEPFINPEQVSNVILTHAHIDHSGFLPRFVKDGYAGPIFCSPGTLDLCQILLPDSAHLQEEDAEYANRTGHSHHRPALPLYTVSDAERALKLFQSVNHNTWKQLSPHASFQLLHSGHIIGSTFVQLSLNGENGGSLITFSGDLGNGRSPTLNGPVSISETDYLVLESTYGNRMQPRTSPAEDLGKAINKVIGRGGVLLIPAFSVGRSQDLLFLISQLEAEGKIAPNIPVFLDSPMSIDATRIFLKYPKEHRVVIRDGKFIQPICPTCYEEVRSPSESMALTQKSGPMIIISAAGMLSGGRILHHLKARLPNKENAVLFVGYQAEETKGRVLQSGVPDLRVHHETVPVRAEILTVESLSAHADFVDILEWLKGFKRPPKMIFVNHGEGDACETLAAQIRAKFGYNVTVPKMGESFDL